MQRNKLILLSIVTLILLYFQTGCIDPNNKPSGIPAHLSDSKPGGDLQEKLDSIKENKRNACVFDDPDTSLSNIRLRDNESSTRLLQKKLKGDTTYYFGSDTF